MSGIFEELEMFDEGDKVVTRQAIAAATKRLNDNFGGFLRQASTKKEFESRLALVDTDINNMVADVVTEYGGDAERIASAVKETVKTAFTPTTPSNNDFPPCKNCGGHGCKECTNDPDGSNYDGPPSKDAEAEMPDNLYKGASDRPKHLKAQDEIQIADEHSQVNPWLKKQIQDEDQEDGGNLRNKEANIEDSQPVSKQVPLAEKEGYGGNIEEQLDKAPSAIGTGKIAFEYTIPEGQVEEEPVNPATEQLQAQFENWFNTQPFPDELRTTCLGSFDQAYQLARQNRPDFDQMDPETQLRALIEEVFRIRIGGPEFEGNFPNTPNNNPVLGKTAGAHTVKKKGDKFVVVEDGGKEAAGPFNSKEKAQARAKELNELENLEKEAGFGDLWDKAKGALGFGQGQQAPQTTVSPSYPEGSDSLEEMLKEDRESRPEGAVIYPHNQRNEEPDEVELLLGRDPYLDSRKIYNQPKTNPSLFEEGQKLLASTTPAMEKALALKEAAARGEKRNFFASKPETGDSTEKNEKLPTGDESALDGPSPKIDKKKWKPNATNPSGNLKPIETEDSNSPHPTRQMDIKEKPDYQNDDPFEHDNNVWEREELPTADDNAGFDGTRNIEQLPTKTFPDKNQTNPVTREALAGNERVAIFEDERDILEENVPKDYAPSREGIMSELADLKQRLIENGSSPEEAEAEIKDLVMGMWRTEQNPEELGNIGIEDMRSEFDAPAEEIEIEEVPEEIEEIIERGDDDEDRVEVIHDHEENEDEDPLGFDDPEKLELEEDEDEDLPFDEELSEEELDRLLEEEDKKDHDDEDLFL